MIDDVNRDPMLTILLLANRRLTVASRTYDNICTTMALPMSLTEFKLLEEKAKYWYIQMLEASVEFEEAQRAYVRNGKEKHHEADD